jgi:hypothetical protein
VVKGRERSQKFYFRNEEEVMKDLGLKPAKGSGAGWVEKEDGENDYVMAQLKSTDKQSYKLSQLDIEKLEYHAMVANKIPMFVLQFLNKDSRYALVAIEDIPKLAEYINTGEIKNLDENPTINIPDVKPKKPKKKIKSSKSAREQFFKEKEKAWEQRKYK